MLTEGLPRLYTAKIFAPNIQVGANAFVKFNLAAVRRNGLSANIILSPGDAFVELKINGLGGDYYIPMDLWDLYQLLSECGGPSKGVYWTSRGADVLQRLQKVGVSLGRYEAWRLAKKIPYWPKSELIAAGLTHRSQLLERANELTGESFYNLKFADLRMNIPGGLQKAVFRFGQTQVSLKDQTGRQETQISIKIDYEMEPAAPTTKELVLA